MPSVIHDTKLIDRVVAGLHVEGPLYLIKVTNDRTRTFVIIVMFFAHQVSTPKRRGVLEINVARLCCSHPHVLRHNGTTSFGKQFMDLRISLLQHI